MTVWSAPVETVRHDSACSEARELARVIEQRRLDDPSDHSLGASIRDHYLPRLDLPGFGTEYDDCGEAVPHFCEDCGRPTPVGRTCKRSECPRCAPAWVLDRAPGIVGKLDATARMMSSARDKAVYKHHVVFSPPPGWVTERDDPLDETFHVIRDLLSQMDAEGVVFYHPWAGDADGTDDMGEWKDRLFSDRDWEGDVREELQARPHFHAVCASPHIPGGTVTSDLHDLTDWVVHRVAKRDGSGRSLSDLQDVARAVTYAMSHVGIDTSDERNQSAIRKYGSTWHDAEVLDDSARRADAAVREVAPRLLGIETSEVSCSREVLESEHDREIDHRRTFARSGSEVSDPPDPPDPSDTDMPDKPGQTETVVEEEEETEPCSGRLLHVQRAPDYLADPEWRADAPFSEQLEMTHEQWELGDWDPPPD